MKESFLSREQRKSNSAEQMEAWDAAKKLGRRIFRLDFPINNYLGRIFVPELFFKYVCLFLLLSGIKLQGRFFFIIHKGIKIENIGVCIYSL